MESTEPQREPRRVDTGGTRYRSLAIISWLFAALAFLTLAAGLLGLNIPHFPTLTFVWLGLAVFIRIINDRRASSRP